MHLSLQSVEQASPRAPHILPPASVITLPSHLPYSQGLPAPSQRLLLRLFLRKGPWFQVRAAEAGEGIRE